MFFGSPSNGKPDSNSRSQIQVLQADMIYDKELKVSSLEGLQYFAKQIALLSSKYPGKKKDLHTWYHIIYGPMSSQLGIPTVIKNILSLASNLWKSW
jgi:hypothetical protein